MNLKVKLLIVFLLFMNATMIVFVANMTLHLKQSVDTLDQVLATKKDLSILRTDGQRILFAEEKCTRCHTERRFTQVHGTQDELVQVIRRMQRLPDSKIQPSDIQKIHASLVLLKCTSCHSTERLERMSLLTESEQMGLIRRMQQKPESGITPDEIEGIRQAFHILLGF